VDDIMGDIEEEEVSIDQELDEEEEVTPVKNKSDDEKLESLL
jgi:hypothetical protein